MVDKSISPPRAVAWTSVSIIAWLRSCVERAGGDPASVPDEPYRFMRLPEVTARTGLSRSSVYRKMTEGSFPEPVVLGPLNAAA